MRYDEHLQPEEQHDPTISHLLNHLKMLRATVPVNYELKESLRYKLLERMKQMELQTAHSAAGSPRKRRWIWWYPGSLLAVALTAWLAFGQVASIHYAGQELFTMSKQTLQSASLSASGKWLARLSEEGKLAVQPVDAMPARSQNHKLPRTSGTYHSIAFANNDEQLAVIEQAEEVSRIWVINLSNSGTQSSSRLLYEEKKGTLQDIAWSPDNLVLAFTREEQGRSEIWLANTVSPSVHKLIAGRQPSFSPDGARLGFVQDETVSVLDLTNGSVQTVERGMHPSWQAKTRLTFTTQNGELAAFEWTPAKEMEQTDKVILPAGYDTDIIAADWTKDGRHGLLTQRDQQGWRTVLLTER